MLQTGRKKVVDMKNWGRFARGGKVWASLCGILCFLRKPLRPRTLLLQDSGWSVSLSHIIILVSFHILGGGKQRWRSQSEGIAKWWENK